MSRHGVSSPRPARPAWMRWSLWVGAAYGAFATLLLLSIAVFGDGTAWTYLAALVSFWWLLPAPVVLLMALVLLRSPLCIAALLAPTLVCGYLYGPYLLNAVRQGLNAVRQGDEGVVDLRVATYNLTNGERLDGLLTLVGEHQPDLLLLQEVTWTPEEFAEFLPNYPYIRVGEDARVPGYDAYAVLSRHPITGMEAVGDLPEGARGADLVEIDVGGRRLAVLSIHLASPCLECPEDDPNYVGGTAAAARLRVVEARRYAEVLEDAVERGDSVVVGGDLNASPLNEPLRVLTGTGLVDVQREVGTSPGLTRGPGPGLARVDYVLVAGLTPVGVFEGARGNSTHSPVIADLAWPDADG